MSSLKTDNELGAPTAEVVAAQLEAFTAFLGERGLRLTPERQRILRVIAGSAGHFGPDELVGWLKKGRGPVSRATVYRTLELLLEAGLVGRLELGSLGVRYERELGREHHDHLACLSCGKLFEFTSPEIERLQDEVCRKLDFEPVRHLHRIMGVCGPCRREAPPAPATSRR
jgi:Fur family ferric uptake transcriptional regulator